MVKEKVGIDYGSKLAGTTVIAYEEGDFIQLLRSKKGEDADKMIRDFVVEHQLRVIGLDAPLSLPGIYNKIVDCNDYFYRSCDKELKAMSPMFLGGLTARAMKLKNELETDGLKVYEVYPARVAFNLALKTYGYKSKKPDYLQMMMVMEKLGLVLAPALEIETSHDFDSLLALYAAKRIGTSGECSTGNPQEGLIYY
ncbi:DUF429 domain-containing protein [Roseivirga misakiensis]|uniref:DUF429 domain-containing protein n=1 Tax=Roseivirga misakiensis TaxID=1563681 RepID=A0A1E5T1X6_9BACT|nr:DUF429 domain-containing protein [Roseivirga misakiensis]OEK05375.1 hypothetical protein BFP71_18465 [Roseivirga misakiensis]